MAMPDEFLTVAEIAELLKVNPQTVRNWIDRGELPAVRVGSRRVRVRQTDLDAFIDAGTTIPSEPDEQPSRADDPTTAAWSLLGQALGEASTALEAADRAALVDVLRSLSDAARGLADVLLGEEIAPPSDQ
jgi:excisionase family DNA binding protein